jgi:transcription-repair coupling factor (superfamily II helicase)
VRVEFFGDEIEELRWFAVADQRTLRSLRVDAAGDALQDGLRPGQAVLQPGGARLHRRGDPLLADRMVPVLSLLPAGSIVVVQEPEKVRARAEDLARAGGPSAGRRATAPQG